MRVVCGPMIESAPTLVAPRRLVPGSIVASAAISTSASIQVEPGSITVTPATHVAVQDLAARLGGDDGEVGAVVDAEVDVRVGGAGGRRRAAAARAQHRQHVAEVVLAGGVVVVEVVERLDQRLGVERVGAGVDLADRELLGGDLVRVLGLDDPLDCRRRRRGRCGRRRRDRRARPSSPSRRRRRRGGSRAARRRSRALISGWSPESTTTVSESRTMSWAARTAPPVPSASGWIDGLGALGQAGGEVAVGRDDHRDPPGAGLAGREHRPGDHRPTADGVQDLRQRGAHARALARGHDQDGRPAARRRSAAHARNRSRGGDAVVRPHRKVGLSGRVYGDDRRSPRGRVRSICSLRST